MSEVTTFFNFFLVFYFTVLDEGDIEILKTYVCLIPYFYRGLNFIRTELNGGFQTDVHVYSLSVVVSRNDLLKLFKDFYITVFYCNDLTVLCFLNDLNTLCLK